LWVFPVFVATAVYLVVVSTTAWVDPDPEQRARLAAGWPIAGAVWSKVGLGYVGALAALVLTVFFAVLFAREWLFIRRTRRPSGSTSAEGVGVARVARHPRRRRATVRIDPARVRTVLVVSPRGIGRGVMAGAYLRVLVDDQYFVDVRGIDPPDEPVSPMMQRDVSIVMGMDKSWVEPGQMPKRIMAAPVRAADLVVRLGCPDAFPVPRSTPVLDWDVADPIGADLVDVFSIRDDIRRRVESLAEALALERRSLDLRDRVLPGRRHTMAEGRAVIAYPAAVDAGGGALADTAAGWFAAAEARLLVEIVDAPYAAADINDRGPFAPDFTVPWVASVGAAESALADELTWRGVGGPPTLARDAVALVVEWLAEAGVLRPLSDARRDALRESGRAQRDHDDPFEDWPRGLAGEYPAMAELRHAEEDFDTWEVVPAAALRVYPGLEEEWGRPMPPSSCMT
jgi:protein-tyrosine-phosphatase